MLSREEVDPGSRVTHKNTGLRYNVVELGEDEVLLSPESENLQDLVVPVPLFLQEFVIADRYSAGRGRGRSRGARRSGPPRTPQGPKAKGRIKKMVRDRGFGFIRGDDGKEVFFHRSGMTTGDYDSLDEGDVVEYVIQEGPRGPRAELVRAVSEAEVVSAS
ncbi:MAG TPA: cold shock domain-containing protein [Myxococcota bacterium]|nr:cold shock domain-containing protein [Myxococcota bacterium]